MNIETLDSALRPSNSITKTSQDVAPSFLEMRYKTCECGTTFYKDSELNKHFKETKHKIITRDVSTYQCNICTRVFDTKPSFHQHHTMTHIYDFRETKFSPKVCDICGEVMKSLLGIRVHMATHFGEKKFKCHICEKMLTKKSGLQDHLNIHLNLRPYVCDQCPLRFVSNHQLIRHKKTHQGLKPHGCSKCSKRYSRTSDLKAHFNSVHLHLPAVKRKPRGTGKPRMTIKNYHMFINESQ